VVEVQLREQTKELLNDPLLGSQDLDGKIRHLLTAEYLRQMGRYQRINQALTQKYGMVFDDFLSQRITKQRDYSWEVEKDAMDWETALGGIQTMIRKLNEVREVSDE
jgi:hypothetical protein